MPAKTLGGSMTKPANTRDYTSDFAPAATSGPQSGMSRKAKGSDGSYHIQGRPSTRSGQESDQK